MGKIRKGVLCSISGCSERAVRSISLKDLGPLTSKVKTEGRRAYLCNKHYKEWKRLTKTERRLQKLRYKI